MADAFTLPSDLFIPEACQEYLGFEFYNSLGVLDSLTSLGPLGDRAPIRITNFDVLRAGGEFVQQPVFKPISGLVTRRNYASGGSAVDTLKLESRNDRGVALRCKIGPVALTRDAGIVSKANAGMLEQEIARQAARSIREYIQDAVILTWRTVVRDMTSTLHSVDVWAAASRTNLSTALLARLNQVMGDRQAALTGYLMRSDAHYDLFLEQDGKGVSLDPATTGDVRTLRRAWDMVDSSYLTTADAGYNKTHVLAGGEGGIELEFQSLMMFPPEIRLDQESVNIIVRGDCDFTLRVPGFAFSSSYANPAIGTSSGELGHADSWAPTYSDHREVKLAELTCNSALLS